MQCRTVYFRQIGKRPPPPIRYGKKHNRGYVLIATERGYIREHRLLAEQVLGRFLRKDEVIHHLNGNKSDNAIDNLLVMNNREHNQFHASQPRFKPHVEGYYNQLRQEMPK